LGIRLGSQEAALLFFQLSHKGAFMETSGCYCVNQAIQERSFPAGSACNWSRVGRLRKTLPQASNMCGLLRKQSGWETGWMRGFTVAFVRNVCGRGPYIVPFGWCKLALRISDEPKTHMATWAPAFHGTKLARILQILRPPDGGQPRLLFPGDLHTDGGRHRVVKGHIEKGFNRTNAHANVTEYFDPTDMIFASPSIHYSEHSAYVPQDGERVITREHGELRLKLALDVRFSAGQPGQLSFGIGQQTVHAVDRLCPVLPNSCLEYYTNRQQTHFISAVMLRIAAPHPFCMNVPRIGIVEAAPLPPVGYMESPR